MRGEQSTLAPTSITTTGLPISVGKMPASAGRSTPGHDALHHLGGSHDGAGVAGRDESLRAAIAHQAGSHPQGTVALGAHGARRAVLHGDLLGGVDHLHRQAAVVVVLLQLPAQNFLPADQDDPDPQRLAASTAPSTSAFGALSPPIASTAMVTMWGGWLLLLDFHYFAALVLSAVRAYAMRQLGLMAVGTFGHPRRFQRIVRAAILVRARSGVVSDSAFRYLKEFTPELRGFQIVFRSFRPWRAAHRAPACSSLQSHGVSLRLAPHVGQIPLQSSRQTRCMGISSTICSRKMSSNSIPPPW
jgi:hypothetical protein